MDDPSTRFNFRQDSVTSAMHIYPARYRLQFLLRAKRVKDVSVLQLITGVCVISFAIAAIFVGCYLAYICTGIWCGIVILVSGILGIRAGRLKTPNAVKHATTSSNLTTFFSLLPIIHASIAMTFEGIDCWVFYCNCWQFCHVSMDARMFIDAMILAFCLCAFILAVFVSVLCGTFSNAHCCKNSTVQ
ncbi:uncharacterized protein [Ptychodera flava]